MSDVIEEDETKEDTQELHATFVTEVKEAETNPKQPTRVSSQLAKKQSSANKVVKIEEEKLDWLDDQAALLDVLPELPSRVDPNVVICTVADSIKFSSLKSRTGWRRQFSKPCCISFFQGTYWWVFLDQFCKDKRLHNQELVQKGKSALFNHISGTFFHLFFQMSSKSKDMFLTLFPDAMAQSICLAFATAYPNSKTRLDTVFKENVLRTLSKWVQGVTAPKQVDISHWGSDEKGKNATVRRIKLNLDSGADKNSQSLPGVGSARKKGKNGKGEKKPEMVNLVNVKPATIYTTLELAHSPLMTKFLGGNGSKSVNPLTFRMTQSNRVYHPMPPSFSELNELVERGRQSTEKANKLSKKSDTSIVPVTSLKEKKDNPSSELTMKKPSAVSGAFDAFNNDADEDLYFINQHAKETYQNVAERAEETRKQLLKGYEDQRKALSLELKNVQRTARKQQIELDSSKKKAIKGDIHELSNYLVSMWKIEDE